MLFLKSLKIFKKFKNFFLSFNGDRALRGMIQNVVLGSCEIIYYTLSKNIDVNLCKCQGVTSDGT